MNDPTAVQFPGVPHDVRLSISYAMLAFVAALALQFITDIMEPGTIPRRLRAVARHYGVVFVATALDGLSTKEAARLFGVPQGTIKTRTMRARQLLRAALAEEATR